MIQTSAMLTVTKDDALATAQVMLDKKAHDVVLLEIAPIVAYADYFLIGSGRSVIQVKAIANAVEGFFRSKGIPPLHIEGYTEGRWVLLDYDELIVHVFVEEARSFYDLERLWRDVPRIDIVDTPPSSPHSRRHAH